MDFGLNEEQKLFKRTFADFSDEVVEPGAAERDENEEFDLECWKKMADLGLAGLIVPEEYGGTAAGALIYAMAVEEISRNCASMGVTLSAHTSLCTWPILHLANEEQKQRWLPRLASGESLGELGLTEPSAGSDVGATAMTAVRDGDDYILNGTKIFITNGYYADIYVILVRTGGKDEKHGNSSYFVVEKGTPGFTFGKKEKKLGIRSSATYELVFEDCEVPAKNLLGNPGEGFKVAMLALDSGRIGIASQAVGIARAALDEALSYTQQRRQFGKTINSFQAIQFMIADAATRIEAASWLTLAAADRKDRGLKFTKEASMAKLYASETANKAAYMALQVHGGYGYTKEYKVERLYRDARATTIYEGTSEVQRIVIAREVIKP